DPSVSLWRQTIAVRITWFKLTGHIFGAGVLHQQLAGPTPSNGIIVPLGAGIGVKSIALLFLVPIGIGPFLRKLPEVFIQLSERVVWQGPHPFSPLGAAELAG